VDSFHSSFTGLGDGITMLGVMLGEIAPGGVGSGLYGMLITAVIAMFTAGLMVGISVPPRCATARGQSRCRPGRAAGRLRR
jgi:K+-transporting ATPase A subunit